MLGCVFGPQAKYTTHLFLYYEEIAQCEVMLCEYLFSKWAASDLHLKTTLRNYKLYDEVMRVASFHSYLNMHDLHITAAENTRLVVR